MQGVRLAHVMCSLERSVGIVQRLAPQTPLTPLRLDVTQAVRTHDLQAMREDATPLRAVFTVERGSPQSTAEDLAYRKLVVTVDVRSDSSVADCSAEGWVYTPDHRPGEGTHSEKAPGHDVTVRSLAHLHDLVLAHMAPNLRLVSVLGGALQGMEMFGSRATVSIEPLLTHEAALGAQEALTLRSPAACVQLRLDAHDRMVVFTGAGQQQVLEDLDRSNVGPLPGLERTEYFYEDPWTPTPEPELMPSLQPLTLQGVSVVLAALFVSGGLPKQEDPVAATAMLREELARLRAPKSKPEPPTSLRNFRSMMSHAGAHFPAAQKMMIRGGAQYHF